MQHSPPLQAALALQQSSSSLQESRAPLGAQHFPWSQITVENPSSQQSEKSSHPVAATRTQQVPPLQVASGSQQSESTKQESSAPVGAQHFPASQIAVPKPRQQSPPKELVQPLSPSAMQQVPPLQVALGL